MLIAALDVDMVDVPVCQPPVRLAARTALTASSRARTRRRPR